MKRPEDCTTMADIRAEIDRLDEALVALFADAASRRAMGEGGFAVVRDNRGALDRLRRHERDPEPAVGGEALLWGEVVHIKFGRVNVKSTGTTGGIKCHQGIRVSANNARGLDGHTG